MSIESFSVIGKSVQRLATSPELRNVMLSGVTSGITKTPGAFYRVNVDDRNVSDSKRTFDLHREEVNIALSTVFGLMIQAFAFKPLSRMFPKVSSSVMRMLLITPPLFVSEGVSRLVAMRMDRKQPHHPVRVDFSSSTNASAHKSGVNPFQVGYNTNQPRAVGSAFSAFA